MKGQEFKSYLENTFIPRTNQEWIIKEIVIILLNSLSKHKIKWKKTM